MAVCALATNSALAQKKVPLGKDPVFKEKMAGVRSAVVFNILSNPPKPGEEVWNQSITTALEGFLKKIGFEHIASITDPEKVPAMKDAIEASLVLEPTYNSTYTTAENLKVDFKIGDSTITSATLGNYSSSGAIGISNIRSRLLYSFYLGPKPPYDPAKAPARKTTHFKWTDSAARAHLLRSDDLNEGIYEAASKTSKETFAVIKEGNVYNLYHIKGAENIADWPEGEFKGKATKTATNNLCKLEWVQACKRTKTGYYAQFDGAVMHVLDEDKNKSTFVKMFPSEADLKGGKATGTAFLVNDKGYIVTNAHVVENGKTYKVHMSNEGNPVTAKMIGIDKANDLAVLKLDHPGPFLQPPYTIHQGVSDVGSMSFAYGYPMVTSMGREVKLTSGIISAATGFENSASIYQFSAAVQPGNSGGPLLDEEGRVIGVVQAKHTRADNVGYAIKSPYLNTFLMMMNVPAGPTTSTLKSLKLSDQAKSVSKCVYLIEVE